MLDVLVLDWVNADSILIDINLVVDYIVVIKVGTIIDSTINEGCKDNEHTKK